MRLASAAVVVFLAGLAGPAGLHGLAGAAWAEAPKPYTSRALGFTASFPDAVPYAVKEQPDPKGGGTAAAFDPAGIMYMVGVTPTRPEIAKSKTVDEQLDDGLDGMLAKVKGKLVSKKDIKLGKHPGREVEIELTGGHATFRAILAGSRTFLIGVVVQNGAIPPLPPADFFRSFRLK